MFFMATILEIVTAIATEIFSVGGQLVTFVTAAGHEICLIPIASWLVVLAIGSVRKLIKGV